MSDESAATNVWREFYAETPGGSSIDLHTMASDMAAAIAALRAEMADVRSKVAQLERLHHTTMWDVSVMESDPFGDYYRRDDVLAIFEDRPC